MALNVNRNVDDQFYRYKMPRLIAKVEGKGNGIKTVIVNMTEIAKALNRPPTYTTKYFGCELGAQTQFDSKNDRYIVNGEHDAGKLQSLLDGFIQKFVLCSNCKNPETSLQVHKGVIHQSCKACGHACTIDPRQKLTTFIIKNPPNPEKKDKDDAKKKKAKKDEKEPEPGAEVLNGGAPDSNESNEGDEDWADDLDDAEERQKEILGGKMAALTINADLEKSVEDRLDMFYTFLQKAKKNGDLDPRAVLEEAERLDVKEKAVLLLCRVLFDEKVLEEVKKHQRLLMKFTAGHQKAQKYLLGGIEQLIVAHKAVLLTKVPLVLKAFYDLDLVDEEVVLEWGEKASKKYVTKKENEEIRAKAEPLLKWLKEAEEESDDEDEDGVEIVYTKAGAAGEQKKPAADGSAKTAEADKEADGKEDLNIDDI